LRYLLDPSLALGDWWLEEDELLGGRRIDKEFGCHCLKDRDSYEFVGCPYRYGATLLVFFPPMLDLQHIRFSLNVLRDFFVAFHMFGQGSYGCVVRQGLALD
jgi:hypothetical protein